MGNPAANPLFKHFRQPAIYLKLPSKGKYYAENSIDLPVTGEVPVYPMTVKDEIALKTPDALMNGQGMMDVIASCIPNIKNPWKIPSVDIDAMFIAIRLASYGTGMDIENQCPACKHENEHTVNLTSLLETIPEADFSKVDQVGGMYIRYRPPVYEQINKTQLIAFEEQRLVNSIIQNSELSDEEKAARFKKSLEALGDMNIAAIAASIESITTSTNEVVANSVQITEFLSQCSRITYETIKQSITELTEQNKIKPLAVTCEECSHSYTANLTFDQSNFFG